MIKKHTLLTCLLPTMDEMIGKDADDWDSFRDPTIVLIHAIRQVGKIFPEYHLNDYRKAMEQCGLQPKHAEEKDFSRFDAQQIYLLLMYLYRLAYWNSPEPIIATAISDGRISKMLRRLKKIDADATDDGKPGYDN